MKRTLIVAVAAIALLAGCSSAPAPSPSGSPAPEASAPAEDLSGVSVYYPVALGNTWTYQINNPDPVGVVIQTETMSAVTPDGDDVRVMIDRSFRYENGAYPDFTDSVEYVFHADGSLSVPYQSIPDTSGAQVTIKSGEFLWPSTAEFEAGTPKTGVIEATIEADGSTFDQAISFTITGHGVEEVTVPGGTFQARKLTQDMLISIPSAGLDGLPINATVWLAEGVGQVRSEVPDLLGSGTSVTVELLKFTPGS